ncbi:MAG: COG4223 family protein [Alphaproteobacteria bacterium]
MTKTKKQPIENAAAIIEKFGGIRPMSSKIGVAVTTIQGWKKRDKIPAARKDAILEAAEEHNINLDEFFGDAPSEDIIEVKADKDSSDKSADKEFEISIPDISEKSDDVESVELEPVIVTQEKDSQPKIDDVIAAKRVSNNDNYTELSVEETSRGVNKNVAISVAALVVLLAAVIAMMLPNKDASDRREKLAMNDGAVKDDSSDFKGLVPQNWSKQLDDLKEQVSQAQQTAGNVVESVQVASQKFAEDNGLEERVVQLQSYVSEITDENAIYGLFNRYEKMDDTEDGQEYLDDSVLELSDLLSVLKGKDDSYVNNALDAARSQSVALSQTLGNVPKTELKAAAMLLAMTQVRSALNRDDEAFEGDLGLLMGMVGEDNGELYSSLEKLAPHSKSGVLSINGLQEEFRSVAGDAVAASLRGEDVSFGDQATARFHDILKIEKDGEVISGTETQVKIDAAAKMVASGRIDDAVKFLNKQLNSKELAPLRPWIKKVQVAKVARQAKKSIEKAIDVSMGSGLLGGSQLLSDGE